MTGSNLLTLPPGGGKGRGWGWRAVGVQGAGSPSTVPFHHASQTFTTPIPDPSPLQGEGRPPEQFS